MSGDQEIILAQEQSVIAKSGFEKQVEGTLILTNQRLIFVGATEEEDVRSGVGTESLRFSDVNSLDSIPKSQYNLYIPLTQIDFEKGRHIGHPSLRVRWKDDSGERQEEFVEELTGRKKNLNDWAAVIDKIKSGALKPDAPKTTAPEKDTLEGQILYVLGDMQEKGSLQIEEQVETMFELDLDPDQVEAALKKLVEMQLVDVLPDRSGVEFYRKHSPLGEDDLSS
ncbi:MAG: hypothetical protein ACRECH_00565 [Nitrososphaerales archaeon]